MAKEGQEVLVAEIQVEDTENPSLQEQIAALAHALWQERGCPEGSSEEDWFKAERQVRESARS